MSLKAKLEAVIYAAEEPVTLAQLAQLFAEEAFEFKAEQEAAAKAAEAAGTSSEAQEAVAAAKDEIDYSALVEVTEETTAEPVTEPVAEPEPAVALESQEEAAAPTAEAENSEQASATAEESEKPAPDEAALKREARQRDREVRAILRGILDELIAEYESDTRGVEIREIAGGFRMATKPECHDVVRTFVKSLKPALKLSLPALETLAVIAYKQPVTAPEVNEIRGVDSSGVFGSLLARKLIATAGRKQVIGRPILYKTTKEFLMRFGLKDVTELPSMEEFEKMAAMELEESDTGDQVEGVQGTQPELDEEIGIEQNAGVETTTNDAEPTEKSEGSENGASAEADPAEPPPTQ
jgi:segregation and condensation protein B